MIFEETGNVDVSKEFFSGLNRKINGRIFLVVEIRRSVISNVLLNGWNVGAGCRNFLIRPAVLRNSPSDEHLNRGLKAGLTGQDLPSLMGALSQSSEMHMRKRERRPDFIKKFFEKGEIREAFKDCRDFSMACTANKMF